MPWNARKMILIPVNCGRNAPNKKESLQLFHGLRASAAPRESDENEERAYHACLASESITEF
jgi:hypothetical protein